MEGFAPLIIVFFIFFFNIALAKSNQKGKNVRNMPKASSPIPVEVPTAVPTKGIQKATVEKTHNHKGEVAQTVLLEDREHDWLAQQIREEARLGRKRMQ